MAKNKEQSITKKWIETEVRDGQVVPIHNEIDGGVKQ